jgi:hypothetical protein
LKHGLSSYKLNLPTAWSRLHPIFNEALLLPYHAPTTEEQALTHAPPPPIMVNDVPEFDVESIVGYKTMCHSPFYKVHWRGYPSYNDTWEPLTNLDHAQDAIRDFHAANPKLRLPISLPQIPPPTSYLPSTPRTLLPCSLGQKHMSSVNISFSPMPVSSGFTKPL